MDKMKTKKKLYGGLGDFARQMRAHQMRKKYTTGNPALDAATNNDEAIEGAELPGVPMKGNTDASMEGNELEHGMKSVNADADKWQNENQAALDEMADDEEMQKWMAKQKG